MGAAESKKYGKLKTRLTKYDPNGIQSPGKIDFSCEMEMQKSRGQRSIVYPLCTDFSRGLDATQQLKNNHHWKKCEHEPQIIPHGTNGRYAKFHKKKDAEGVTPNKTNALKECSTRAKGFSVKELTRSPMGCEAQYVLILKGRWLIIQDGRIKA